jgi:hypothetical protein
MKRSLLTTAGVAGLTLALVAAAGCGADELDEAEEIAQSLELEDGGYDMEDELPMFGMDDTLADTDVFDQGLEVVDSMESDVEVLAMNDSPDAVLFDTIVLWGQMPADPTNDQVRDWTGQISVNRGALLIRRTIRFEGIDRLMPRTDRRTVEFRSVTRPHADGLVLTIIDPTPGAAEPLLLTYATDGGPSYDLPVSALVDGIESRVVDAEGNRVTAQATPRLVDVCQHGFLRGRWHKVAEHRGVFLGGVSNALGNPVGHIRGIYGERLNGDKVFFGKYIDRDGRFQGIFRGTYDAGHFQGRWLNRGGEIGAMGGEYRETVPGPRIGGHFFGRWTELSCDVPLPRPGDSN